MSDFKIVLYIIKKQLSSTLPPSGTIRPFAFCSDVRSPRLLMPRQNKLNESIALHFILKQRGQTARSRGGTSPHTYGRY